MTKDPIELLRRHGAVTIGTRDDYCSLSQLADEIEAQYMKLPLDAEGVPIGPGDRLVYGPETVVAAFVTDDFICTPHGTQAPSQMCRHVKPDTVESLLEEFVTKCVEPVAKNDFSINLDNVHYAIAKDDIIDYAERIRRAVEQ